MLISPHSQSDAALHAAGSASPTGGGVDGAVPAVAIAVAAIGNTAELAADGTTTVVPVGAGGGASSAVRQAASADSAVAIVMARASFMRRHRTLAAMATRTTSLLALALACGA